MTTVIGVRFKKAGKVYYFDPTEVWPKAGEYVVVETSRGVEMGEVITGAREVEDDKIIAPLKKVIRVATAEDVRRAEYYRSQESEALRVCQDRVALHKLEMKLVDVEYTFDGSKIIFYFTANGRVDFRELVKDLASVFKTRIELRQIGVRDEAKMLGGLGACGRQICCDAFLSDFQPVSIKMAKEQSLSLNPTKISGQCGRLMCCLKYEQSYYETALKRLPKVGREAMTPDGIGIVIDINPIREKVKLRMRTGDDGFEMREYPMEDVSKPEPGAVGDVPRNLPPIPRPTRKPRPAAKPEGEAQAAEGEAEKPQRRHIPRPKGPKQASTDSYFEALDAAREADSDAEVKPEPKDAAKPEREGTPSLRPERRKRGPRSPRPANPAQAQPAEPAPAPSAPDSAPEA